MITGAPSHLNYCVCSDMLFLSSHLSVASSQKPLVLQHLYEVVADCGLEPGRRGKTNNSSELLVHEKVKKIFSKSAACLMYLKLSWVQLLGQSKERFRMFLWWNDAKLLLVRVSRWYKVLRDATGSLPDLKVIDLEDGLRVRQVVFLQVCIEARFWRAEIWDPSSCEEILRNYWRSTNIS